MFALDLSEELFPSLFLLVLWGLSLYVARNLFDGKEIRLVVASFAFHVLATFAVVSWAQANDGADMIGYVYSGRFLADLMRREPLRAIPEVLSIFCQNSDLDLVPSEGSSTGSMKAVAGLTMFFVTDSAYASCLFLSALSFYGKLALYWVFRESYSEAFRTRLLLATTLVPSCLFWSCGLVKETIAMATLGWLLLGVHRFAQGRILLGATIFSIAAFALSLIKPYVLFPFVLAGGVYIHDFRAAVAGKTGKIKPLSFVIGIGLAFAALLALGAVFPRYALETISDEARHTQEGASMVDGNSNYSLGALPESPRAQLALAPVALLTAVFRPLPFEATGGTSLICSLETTFLLLLAVNALRKRSPLQTWLMVRASPLLTFSLIYTVLFGVAVGLTSLNFGTLSRYRVPLMPFYVALIVLLGMPTDAVAAEVQPDSSGPEPAHRVRRRVLAKETLRDRAR